MAMSNVTVNAKTGETIVGVLHDQYGTPSGDVNDPASSVAKDILAILRQPESTDENYDQEREVMVCVWLNYSDSELAQDTTNKIYAALS